MLYVIGIGPGNPEFMTGEAALALAECELIVGYPLYLEFVKKQFPNKEYYATPMTREIERCRQALAQAGTRQVALVCSGDAGVYGMAGPVLELAPEYPGTEIRVISGVTAALSGAAVLGAPLMHDFAVISLSDRLTPMEEICRKLKHAAESEFVIALYNPSSKKRKDYLRMACDVLLSCLAPSTVCGYVRNVGRDDPESGILTLEEMRYFEADMFTTIFIGNRRTKAVDGRMVTPRGYGEKIRAQGSTVTVAGTKNLESPGVIPALDAEKKTEKSDFVSATAEGKKLDRSGSVTTAAKEKILEKSGIPATVEGKSLKELGSVPATAEGKPLKESELVTSTVEGKILKELKSVPAIVEGKPLKESGSVIATAEGKSLEKSEQVSSITEEKYPEISGSILVAAGTTEGRLLCEYFAMHGQTVYAFVATEYGEEMLPESPYILTETGRKNADEMLAFLQAHEIKTCYDAMHPYATLAHKNMKEACARSGCAYTRVLREFSMQEEHSASEEVCASTHTLGTENESDASAKHLDDLSCPHVLQAESDPHSPGTLSDDLACPRVLQEQETERKEDSDRVPRRSGENYSEKAPAKEVEKTSVGNTSKMDSERKDAGDDEGILPGDGGTSDRKKVEIVRVSSIREAAEYLKQQDGNILVTTGSRELGPFAEIENFENRIWVRVLPSTESLDACRKAGIQGKQIIAMHGPFSREMNELILREHEIRWLVTKDSGKAGGFSEKLEAAETAGARVILVERPREEAGVTLQKLISTLNFTNGML